MVDFVYYCFPFLEWRKSNAWYWRVVWWYPLNFIRNTSRWWIIWCWLHHYAFLLRRIEVLLWVLFLIGVFFFFFSFFPIDYIYKSVSSSSNKDLLTFISSSPSSISSNSSQFAHVSSQSSSFVSVESFSWVTGVLCLGDSPSLGGTLLVSLWQSKPTFKIFRWYS